MGEQAFAVFGAEGEGSRKLGVGIWDVSSERLLFCLRTGEWMSSEMPECEVTICGIMVFLRIPIYAEWLGGLELFIV